MHNLAPQLIRLVIVALCSGPSFGADVETPQTFAPGDSVPPAFRLENQWRTGAEFLGSLPDGTGILIQRNDGTDFRLELNRGKISVAIPTATLTDDGMTFVSPLGYRIGIDGDEAPGVVVTAPSGKSTRFVVRGRFLSAFESDHGLWDTGLEDPVLRLPDATRIDILELRTVWEVFTLGGERFRLHVADGNWEQLPSIPSPPLIPAMGVPYAAGDGDDWRVPAREDHVVFGWNWYPYGFTIDALLAALETEHRRRDLVLYFNGVERMPEPFESAALLLGRRLALTGGDRVTWQISGETPRTVFILPGPVEPDFFLTRPIPRARQNRVAPSATR